MGAQAIDLSAGLVPAPSAPIDLSAGLVPKPPPSAQPSLLERAKANFHSNTQGKQPGDNAIVGAIHDFSAGAGDVVKAIAHPIRTIDQMTSAADPMLNYVAGNHEQAAKDAANMPGVARMLGQIGTGAIVGEIASPVLGAAAKVAKRIPIPTTGVNVGDVAEVATLAAKNPKNIPAAASQGAARVGRTLYPKNISIAQQEIAAQNIVRAMIPDPAAVPNIKSASTEIPDALAAAEKNGTQINGKLDAAKAIRDRADEIQAHYDENLLRPSAGETSAVPENYSGETVGSSGRATLGQINDRVDAINAELKSNFRKKVASQTTEANASDSDLIGEKNALTDILHKRLADATGLQPGDIASVRVRAGKLRNLAQEVEVSADRDSIATGRRDTSGGPLSIKNPIEAVTEKIGGGQEIIGNRIFRNALDQFKPVERPLPQPVTPGPNVATTPEMAQREFLRRQQLEQAAQDAASGRRQATQTYREEQGSNNRAVAQTEATRAIQSEQAAQDAARQRGQIADTARLDNRISGATKWASEGYTKVMQHLANDTSSGLARADLVKIAQTPKGNGLLMRASGMTPGSPMMRSLVKQIKALVP